jgi:nitrogen fixation protein FixH
MENSAAPKPTPRTGTPVLAAVFCLAIAVAAAGGYFLGARERMGKVSDRSTETPQQPVVTEIRAIAAADQAESAKCQVEADENSAFPAPDAKTERIEVECSKLIVQFEKKTSEEETASLETALAGQGLLIEKHAVSGQWTVTVPQPGEENLRFWAEIIKKQPLVEVVFFNKLIPTLR